MTLAVIPFGIPIAILLVSLSAAIALLGRHLPYLTPYLKARSYLKARNGSGGQGITPSTIDRAVTSVRLRENRFSDVTIASMFIVIAALCVLALALSGMHSANEPIVTPEVYR